MDSCSCRESLTRRRFYGGIQIQNIEKDSTTKSRAIARLFIENKN